MKKTYIAMAILMVSILVPMLAFAPVNAAPRSDVDVTFYGSPDAAFTALVGGQADFLVWALTKTQKEAVEANPNLQLVRVDEQGMYEFDLNNNYTILSYPGVKSPTSDMNVRKAIARLTDKDYIVANILEFFGTRIDSPMAATSVAQWADPSIAGANYPYPYNPQEAANLLTAAGFADTDANGWLNYPVGWPGASGADSTDYPLVTCVRSDHAHRLAAGQYLINQLEVTLAGTTIGAGFKTTGTTWQQPRSVLSPKVMGNRDFHIYTGGWSVGRFPTHLFSLYHSQFWYPYGPSYVVGMNSSNLPNYPDVDAAVDAIWYTDSIATAQTASKAFTVMHANKCLNVPLWAYSSYWSYAKTLVGVVNEDGYGFENDYTFLNAYRTTGGPIRVAVTNGPDRLNILYSQWFFEYSMLNRYTTAGMNVEPYNLGTDVPWVVRDWTVGTWDDAGTEKSVVTYYIRKDVAVVAPGTGAHTAGRNFNAYDWEFTIWYNYAFSDSWIWSSFMDVRYTKVVDVNADGWMEMQIYFDDKSYWFYTAPTGPFLCGNELLDPLNAQTTESWAQAGTGQYDLANNVVKVVSCTLDGAPLVEGTDYIIRAGYDMTLHNGFVPLVPMTGTVSITYWYADIPATGFFLGGLPWTTTMYTIGMHYPQSVTTDPPGIGDTFVLKKNDWFFLDGQPATADKSAGILGEIDWSWKWTGTTPRSGSYKIDIFDVVRATGAYCTRGDTTFNPKYFAGSDIDSTDLCHIGIFDLVTITGQYGKTFGTPDLAPLP